MNPSGLLRLRWDWDMDLSFDPTREQCRSMLTWLLSRLTNMAQKRQVREEGIDKATAMAGPKQCVVRSEKSLRRTRAKEGEVAWSAPRQEEEQQACLLLALSRRRHVVALDFLPAWRLHCHHRRRPRVVKEGAQGAVRPVVMCIGTWIGRLCIPRLSLLNGRKP